MKELAAFLETAKTAALAGGRVIAEARRSGQRRFREKSRADFVTDVDLASERAIAKVIRAAHPDHAITGEEGTCGADVAGTRWTWVVDPLDGTTNFIHDIPFIAVSVALEEDGVPVVGAVLDPVRDELYTATRGGGAFSEGRRLHVSEASTTEASLVLTGIPFRSLDVLPQYLRGMERIARASAGIRRMGSAALDLCLVASGRAEAFWEYGLSRWDTSAGSLLVEEAGGLTSDLRGGADHLATGNILASNGRVHHGLLDLIGER